MANRTWRGNTYRFTVTAANATVSATYTNNGQTFTVTDTIAGTTTLYCTGTGSPTASGTLTKSTGTGDATITFSSFIAPNTNWGTTTNWLENAVPLGGTGGDDIFFDNRSLACILNVAGVGKTINFTAYTDTITMNNLLTISGNISLGSGMTFSGSSGITVNTSTGTATLRSNTKVFPNTLTLGSNFAEFTVSLADDWTVGGLVTGANSVVLTNNTINVTGDVSLTGGLGTGSNTSIKINGTGNQSLNGSGSAKPVESGVEIDKTTGIFTLSGIFYWRPIVGRSFKFTKSLGGQITTGSTLVIVGGGTNGTLDVSGLTLSNLTLGSNSANASFTLGSDVYATGTTSSVGNGLNISGAFRIYVRGDFTKTGPLGNVGTFAGLVFDGIGTQIWSDTNASYLNFNIVINKASGTIQLGTNASPSQNIYGIATNRTLTHSSGIINPQTTTFLTQATTTYNISSSGFILYNWSVVAGTHTINVGTITMNNNLTLAGNTTFAGTGGWTAGILSDTTAGRVIVLQSGSSYTVTSNLNLFATLASPITLSSSTASAFTKFTLNNNATQSVYFVRANRVDSGDAQTIWDTVGTMSTPLTNTINWNVGVKPPPFTQIFIV